MFPGGAAGIINRSSGQSQFFRAASRQGTPGLGARHPCRGTGVCRPIGAALTPVACLPSSVPAGSIGKTPARDQGMIIQNTTTHKHIARFPEASGLDTHGRGNMYRTKTPLFQ